MIKLQELLKSEHYDMVSLFESPMRISSTWVPDLLHSFGKNTSFTEVVKEKATLIDKFKNYSLYEYTAGNDIINVLVYDITTIAFFQFQLKNNIVCMNRVWQDAIHFGLCRDFMFNYILKKYDGILSDDKHTEMGERYWKKLLQQAVENKYKIFVIKNDEKIPLDKLTDIDNFYFDSTSGLEYRFLILK